MGDQIRCQGCGIVIRVTELGRKPCPQCGDTRRIFDVELTEEVKVYDGLSFKHKNPKKSGKAKILARGSTDTNTPIIYRKWLRSNDSLIEKGTHIEKPLPILNQAKSFINVRSRCHNTRTVEQQNQA